MKRALSFIVILVLAATFQPHGATAAPEKTIDKTFPLKMGGKLELNIDTGGLIKITGGAREEAVFNVKIGGRDAEDVNVTFEPSASGLVVHSSCEKHRGCDCDLEFTITVPSKCDIATDSKGGEVDITGVEGALSGETMGGALKLARIKGDIHLKTMGGAVTVEDSEADGKVSTMGGAVRIRNVKGNLEGATMGGNVTYENVSGRSAETKDESVEISTKGGDIKVSDISKTVRAKTWGGDVEVGKVKEVNVSTMGGDVKVEEAPAGAHVSTMGGDITIHSAGKYVRAKTMGGDVEVDAVDGGAVVSTMGGDVKVTMVGDPKTGDRDVDLSSMGGDITLTVPGGLSMKFDLEIKCTKSHRECKIESDFPVHVVESQTEHGWLGRPHKEIHGTGSVGSGEHLIKIKTVDGNITIKKGS